jgi:OOP family OmpA-OmpF porin
VISPQEHSLESLSVSLEIFCLRRIVDFLRSPCLDGREIASLNTRASNIKPKGGNMKTKRFLKLLTMVMAGAFVVGCAAHQMQSTMGAFTPKTFAKGHYGPKVDNFMVVLDASSSMEEKTAAGHQKFALAKEVVERMNLTLPALKVNGALRTFGHSYKLTRSRSSLFYGLTEYSQSGFQAGLDKVTRAGGTTPMAAAIHAATNDLADTAGKIAVIVVSDGKPTDSSPLQAAEAMKAKLGDRLCIYTVHVGEDPAGMATMEGIAKAGECGFSVRAEDIMAADSMADFVKKVFLHVDTDGDGVYDYMDKCPGTPAGVKVDASGCPLDTDGDGVYDHLDKCPGTPKGLTVDSTGCPPDSDGDGVYDYKDKCPGTPAGATVNADGCWVLGDVLFDYDKAVVKPVAFDLLDDVIQVLKKNPGLKVSLDGHTDSRGPAPYNMKLSERRAEAVKAYLINKGIAAERLSSAGYGLTKPIASNASDDGRALNRRVEIRPVR